jgi:glutaredoxin
VQCMGEKVILTSPDCVGCEQLKEHLTSLGLIHKYRVIDVTTKEGYELAERLHIKHVPNCVIVENTSEGMKARSCSETEFLELLRGK